MIRNRARAALVLALFAPPLAASDVLRYDIDAKVDGRTLVARARIAVPARLAEGGELRLVLPPPPAPGKPSPLSLDAVASSGRALPVRLEGRVAVVPAASTLDVDYRLLMSDESRAVLGYDQYAGEGDDLWFPDVTGAGGAAERFRDFSVRLEVPSGTTLLTSAAPDADGRMEARHVEGFAINLGEGFETFAVERDGVSVVAFYPKDLRAPFQKAAGLASDAIAWYRKAYGFFPVSRIGIAPHMPTYSGGFPASNFFYIHRKRLDPDFLAGITAHELGHYYWGRHVLSSARERLDWLMLGNGIWADQLYLAERAGRSVEAQWRTGEWFRRHAAAEAAGRPSKLGISAAEESALKFDYNSEIRHAKGAVGVWVEAQRLGKERFLALQRALLADFKDRPLTPEEFARRLEEAGAPGAAAFYAGFVEDGRLLDFAIESVEGSSVRVARRGRAPYPLEVEARDAAGERQRKRLAGRDAVETLVFDLAPPLTVVLDPDGILPMAASGNAEVRKLFEMTRAAAANRSSALPPAADGRP